MGCEVEGDQVGLVMDPEEKWLHREKRHIRKDEIRLVVRRRKQEKQLMGEDKHQRGMKNAKYGIALI